MNRFPKKLAGWAFLATLLACQPSPTVDPSRPSEKPVGDNPAQTTEAGKPLGAAVQQSVGPAGGSITVPAAGQALTLTFPAGALRSTTPVKVQLVENKAPGGIGPALEVFPKDIALDKPVTISWQYGADGLNGTGSSVVGMAYQQSDGTWIGKTNLTADEAGQRLTASRPAFDLKHPVAFYQNYYLQYHTSTLYPNEEVEMAVMFQPNHSDAEEAATRGTLLAPLKAFEPVGHENLKNWRLNGAEPVGANRAWGLLGIHDRGQRALFVAPENVPKVNPVAISVDLKTGGRSRIMLVANFQISAVNRLTAAGRVFENAKVTADLNGNDLYVTLTEAEPAESGYAAMSTFRVSNYKGPGTYEMEPSLYSPVLIDGKETGRQGKVYSHVYQDPASEMVFASGNVTITKETGKKGKLAGSFSAMLYNYNKSTREVRRQSFGGSFQSGIR
ncbi:hypothetical protein [Tellurirhabdus rosea]|uniref:hypothetical protein n=1 Tax=Tellurirhabdus rosea TaxID=2674997 RepID=UPI0022526005|nr:hypothetical protein [Tellurirhabdus rosea]